MLKPQVLERPLQLRANTTAMLKINGRFLIVTVVSDVNGVVSYTFPLRADKTVYTVPKSCVFVPLKDLSKEHSLNLSPSPAARVKYHFGYGNFISPNSQNVSYGSIPR